MKQYLTPEQTAKLIELGFEKPKSIGGYEPTFVVEYEGVEVSNVIIGENTHCPIFAYSIGELIEMLDGVSELEITRYGSGWGVYDELRAFTGAELIDTLYDMIVKLKEGVI